MRLRLNKISRQPHRDPIKEDTIMKKSPIAIALATALALGASAPVLAETSPSQSDSAPSAQQPGTTGAEMGSQTDMDTSTQMQAPGSAGSQAGIEQDSSTGTSTTVYNPEDYDGKDVVNANGDKLGEVEQLVISTGDQQVYAVIGVGGFLGIGDKDVAIPLEQLQPQGEDLTLASGITEDELKNSMEYNESEFSAFEPEKRGAADPRGAQDQPRGESAPIERDDSAPKTRY